MEASPENLMALAEYLKKTLSPNPAERKPAEQFLESVEDKEKYGILLLTLLKEASVDDITRHAASVTFKNFVKRNWAVGEDETDKISAADRRAIKQHIVSLMLNLPEKLQRQLSDAISIIGRQDFPGKWDELLPELVTHMKDPNADFHKVNGILRTVHSLCKRYRHEFRSDALFSEIKYVLGYFARPLTDYLQSMLALAEQHANNPEALKVIFNSLVIICKLFYSLNYQDLPEFFEDNMAVWMKSFHTLLTVDNKLLKTDDDDEAGPLEYVKSQICDNVALYAQKYDEEFKDYLRDFVRAIWTLLVNMTAGQVKYDLLVCNAIQFLSSVASHTQYKDIFEDQSTLTTLCQQVVVPNMQLRDVDQELFEDNPEEYIRRDIEGSDVDTRRRAACDLVHALCKLLEGPVTSVFQGYVAQLKTEYKENPEKNWQSLDTAIYLVATLASKAKTEKFGSTKLNMLVNLNDFFSNTIAALLQSPNVDEHPVLKAAAIKFVVTFRQHLPREVLVLCFNPLTNHLRSKSQVVHSYAAHGIDRLLMLAQPGGGQPFGFADLEPLLQMMLTNLLALLQSEGAPENDYVMRAILRVLAAIKENVFVYAQSLLPPLKNKLAIVAKNPSKPHFNHCLFESISCLIRFTCVKDPAAVGHFEQELFPLLEVILESDVIEFLPYVFQILSLALELRPPPVPQSYLSFFPLLLMPVLWDRQGNIPPLVRLLQAYVVKGSNQILEMKKLGPLLGVWQKLIASKTNDHEGYHLLETIMQYMPMTALNEHLRQLFMIIFQRLSTAKTGKFVKGTLTFFCLFAGKFGGHALVTAVDSVQPKIFAMVVEKLFVADLQKVSGAQERKICAVGVTKLLTDTPVLLSSYVNLWPQLLQAAVHLFELQEEKVDVEEDQFLEIDENSGYQAVYSRLVFAGKAEHDAFPEVTDSKGYFAQALYQVTAKNSQVQPLIQQLPADIVQCVQVYLEAGKAHR